MFELLIYQNFKNFYFFIDFWDLFNAAILGWVFEYWLIGSLLICLVWCVAYIATYVHYDWDEDDVYQEWDFDRTSAYVESHTLSYLFLMVFSTALPIFFGYKLITQTAGKVAIWLYMDWLDYNVNFWMATFEEIGADGLAVWLFQFTKLIQYNSIFLTDGLSYLFIFLTALIFPICLVLVSGVKKQSGILTQLVCILCFLVVVAFTVKNLFVFYCVFEFLLIPMFFIIGFWGSRSERTYAAYLFFLYTLVGSSFFLLALVTIHVYVGDFNFNVLVVEIPTLPIAVKKIIWVGLFVGFAFKVPLFPFHSWLTSAHVEAPTVGSVILASLLLKLGGYGLIRFVITLLPDVSQEYQYFLFALCAGGYFFATVCAFRQLDLKRFVAYTSIAHMHFITLSLFTLTNVGYWGGVHSMISHGFIAAGLFFLVGCLYDRLGVRLLPYISGLVNQLPVFSFFWAWFLFANAGLPFLSGFPGEFCGLLGVFTCNFLVGFIVMFGFILGVVYSFIMLTRTVFGAPSFWVARKAVPDLTQEEYYISWYLGLWVFILGVSPELVMLPLRGQMLTYVWNLFWLFGF